MDDHIVDANKKVDRIIKAAREAGWQFLQLEMAAPAEIERLSRFYTIAFKAGMERAAEIAEARKHITPDWQLDQHYNQACTHCAAAIRTMKDKS